MTQQPWGGAPDHWTRGQSPWAASFGQQAFQQWPAPPPSQQPVNPPVHAAYQTQPEAYQAQPQTVHAAYQTQPQPQTVHAAYQTQTPQAYQSQQPYQQPAPYQNPYQGQYQPYQSQQAYYRQPQQGYRRPPKRRSGFGTLMRVAVTIFLIMMAFSVIRGVLESIADPGTSTPSGTSTQPADPGSNTGNTDPSNPGTTDPGTGTAQYQNEGYEAPPADFNPPDLPQPDTMSEAKSWLEKNKIYGQSVPSPTRCAMEPIATGLTKKVMEARLNEQMACLMAVWEPTLKAANFEMPRPPVTVYTSKVTTACGVMDEVNAAYCAGDQHVYYALPLLDALPSKVADTKYAAEDVIAHEFGHAVQARTGILIADKAMEQKASDADAKVMSRRTEQQADCFAGLYVASVAQSQSLTQDDLQNLVDMTYYLGDDALSGDDNIDGDHGLGKNRQTWFAKGVQTTSVGVCNTWTVPASQVR